MMVMVAIFATVASIVLMALAVGWAIAAETWHDVAGALLIFLAGAGLAWLVFVS